MTEVIKTLSIDLARKSNNRIVFAVQNDFSSRKLKFNITNDGAPCPLEAGATAAVGILRPDGVSAAYSAQIGNDGSVSFTIPVWALSIVGEVSCNLIIFDSKGSRISSSAFSLDVEAISYLGDDVTDEDSYPLLVGLMNEIGEIKSSEEDRVTEENTRSINEQMRQGNEKTREENEQVRKENEQLRKQNEERRNRAEEDRANSELARQGSENLRQTNEALREGEEGTRKSNEALRESAEDARQSSEALRESAEAQRVQNEIERNNMLSDKLAGLEEIQEQYGYIDNALDAIIEIQNSLIGGEN